MSAGASAPIRILIVDDDAAIREALADVIAGAPDLELIGMAEDADEAIAAAAATRPDIALVDVHMPGGGPAAVEGIRRQHPRCGVLALSAFEERQTVIEMLLAGASGYVVKGVSTTEILESIRRTERGQASLSVDMLSDLVGQLVSDVSERDRSAVDLERSQKPALDLIEFAPDAVVAADVAGRIVLVNEQTERMFGIEREDLLGRPVEQLLPEQFRDAYVGHRDAYLQKRTRQPIGLPLQLHGRHADGSEFPVDISLASLDTEDGPLVVAFVRDVTERERVAAEVAQLEAAVRDDEVERELIKLVVKAQDEERVRIAGEVHDDSVQVMTAALMRLQLLREQIPDPDHLVILARLEGTMQEAIKRLRRLLFVLHPRALDTEGLVSTLRTYLQDLGHDSQIRSQLNDQLAREPSPDVRAVLYRIALEGVTNVVKHSRADHLEVTLESEEEGVLLRISDDGRGMEEAETLSPGHLGITTMRERAKMAGGRLRIDSTPDGTTVEAWLPDAGAGVVDVSDGSPVGAG